MFRYVVVRRVLRVAAGSSWLPCDCEGVHGCSDAAPPAAATVLVR
eukprot:COSAG01_NODE_536_length_15768_cov_58.648286_13_plen_45_part_00